MVGNGRTKILAVLAAAAVAVLGAEGVFLSTYHGAAAPHAPASPRPSPSRPARGPLLSPFTGERVARLRRVLAVKIGNTLPERPATGLAAADLVYLVPVEGGLSRILAIFSTRFPPVVGPVRSAREDDLALLRQFGRPAFAYSGAAPRLLPVVEHARLVSLYAGVAGGYSRSYARLAPYNLYAHTRQLLAEAPRASKAQPVGFRFGGPPSGGRRTRSVAVSYPSAHFRFTWSAARGRWLVRMDGSRARTAAGLPLGAPTVVIQYTTVRTSAYREYGFRPPYAETVGTGRAVVLRDGMAFQGRWSRPSAAGGTTFTTVAGRPMTFARGQVWIVLTAAGGRWPRTP
jgi:Protein of unknown function (DUF3048) N-terminal domain/Protein of unknown function (DUF3048) C-terminal domain